MKKFFMVTPLQPVGIKDGKPFDYLHCNKYEAVGNTKLQYNKPTRFPIIPVINGYAEKGEEIRVITVTPDTPSSQIHLKQLEEEVSALQKEKGFICHQVESVALSYAGDVSTQIEMFHKLLSYMDDDDVLYGCLTYGVKPMPIAELMAIQYGYRVLNNTTIGCLVYGELDHSLEPAPMRIFDITALVQLDEIVRVLADRKISNPKKIIDSILEM